MSSKGGAKKPGPRPKWKCEDVIENQLRARGFHRIAGADEVGRGSLFGAVVAAAVILSPDKPIVGLNDSKQLDPETREALAETIRNRCVAWAIAAVDCTGIDRMNIYEASRIAMKLAIQRLDPLPEFVLVDAVPLALAIPQQPLVQGDERCHAIAAASILAKVHRDAMMREWDKFYPQYGLASHKGYHSPDHIAAIRRHGPSPLHRMSFAPIRDNSVWSHLDLTSQQGLFQ